MVEMNGGSGCTVCTRRLEEAGGGDVKMMHVTSNEEVLDMERKVAVDKWAGLRAACGWEGLARCPWSVARGPWPAIRYE